MTCKKCGKELKNGATVCSKCGTKVEASTEKIQISYEDEDVFVEPPIITESHTFIDEGDFLKKVLEADQKEQKKKKKKKKKEKEAKKKKITKEVIHKSPMIWFCIFILMFLIGVVLGFVVFPNILKSQAPVLTDKEEQINSFSSESWTSDEFILDGVYYRLNTSYSNFQKNGWEFDLSRYGYDNGYTLRKGEKITTNVDLESIKFLEANVQVGFVNLNPNARDIKDCQIWSITIDNHTSKTPVNFMLPGGVQMGSSEQEIQAVYGSLPNNQVYRSDQLRYTTYHYTNDYTQYLDLTIYDEGGLQMVSFRHY